MAGERVLVVNAPNNPCTDRSLLIEPIDVLTVASYLQNLGYDVRVRDLDHEQLPPSVIKEELKRFKPAFTVIPFDYHIPLYTAEAIPGAAEIALAAAQFGSKVIIGGRPSNRYPEKFLVQDGVVVVVGEMELALKELLALHDWSYEALSVISGIIFRYRNSRVQTISRKEKIELDTLPIPNRFLVNPHEYIDVHTLLSSRGCVEKCSFCPVHTFWGRWRYRSATLVVDEIQYLVEQVGAKKILFLDDHAMVNKKRLQEICRGVIARNIKITLGCLGTVSACDVETLDLMQAAGFRWIHYGAEFADDRVLQHLKKRICVEQIHKAITETKKRGIRVRTSWIFDAPRADENGLAKTCDLILETKPDEIRAHFLTLRAGAPLADQLMENGGVGVVPGQYIHADVPHVECGSLKREIVIEKVEELTTRLAKSGYVVVRKPSDWEVMNDSRNNTTDVKFISFCPGRYGIGWGTDGAAV